MATPAAGRPTCSVVVCTRSRPGALLRCLQALEQLAYPSFDVVVVDNAPSDNQAFEVARRAGVEYVAEPVPGLSRARNTGARACSSEVIAFIDDDAVPDPTWLAHLAARFDDPEVAAATGRTLPVAEAGDMMLSDISDLGPSVIRLDRRHPRWFEMASFGGIGNGNNMAFRRCVFDEWRGFDERLGRGALLSSCEEHRAFAQLIERGYAVVYTPDARVRHPVPATLAKRQRQYVQSHADLAAYAVFLFAVTRQRWRVARYVAEALIGTRRHWRFHTAPAPHGISRWRLARAYLAGACRGLRTSIGPTMRSHRAPSDAARASANAKTSPVRVAGE
jgi:cellulose synthase/poly-beta-1,6-N-acetylglucosamine synthase-like glycosyltransferase